MSGDRDTAVGGGLVVRRATDADLDTIWSLLLELADYERLSDAVTGTPESLRRHLAGEAEPRIAAAVAERDAVPVGYAIWFRAFSSFRTAPVTWLEDLYVQPAARGSGAGLALFAFVARDAVQAGSVRMEWNVLPWNEPAVRFYRARGAATPDPPQWHTWQLSGEELERVAGEAG